jgi:hypothetical protein
MNQRNRSAVLLTIAASIATCLAFSHRAAADVPMLLNYQGNLTAPDGTPKNGTFSMQFSVYDAESGGNQLSTGTRGARRG